MRGDKKYRFGRRSYGNTVEFERCVDFLARMIEKYGSELLQELNGLPKEDKAEDNCQQEQQQNTLGND